MFILDIVFLGEKSATDRTIIKVRHLSLDELRSEPKKMLPENMPS